MHRILLFTFLLLSGVIYSQLDIQASVDKKTMSEDEFLMLRYDVYSDDARVLSSGNYMIDFPSLDDFNVIAQNKESSVFSNNNQTVYQEGVTLVLQPKRSGNFSIPAATLKYNKIQKSTQSFTIKVDSRYRNNSHNGVATNRKMSGFLEFSVDNKQPYLNEIIIGTLTFYHLNPYNLKNVTDFSKPSFDGFDIELLDGDTDYVKQKTLNNTVYYGKTLYKVMLSPMKTGTLKIEPFEATVRMKTGDFSYASKNIKSNKTVLEVQSFPDGSPADFNGAVGSYRLTTKVKNNIVPINQVSELEIAVQGNGNFKSLKNPSIQADDNIKMYPAQVKEDLKITQMGEVGQRMETVSFEPMKEGEYSVTVEGFSYFDPDLKRYVSIEDKILNIKVVDEDDVALANSDENRGMIDYTDADNHETDEDSSIIGKTSFISKYGAWIGGGALLLALLGGVVLFARKKKELTENEEVQDHKTSSIPFMKTKVKATKSAEEKEENKKILDRQFLRAKVAFLEMETDKFYSELRDYLSKIQKISPEYAESASDLKVELQKQSYSPISSEQETEKIYQKMNDLHDEIINS